MFTNKKSQQKWAILTLSIFFVIYVLSIIQLHANMDRFSYKTSFKILYPYYLSVIFPMKKYNKKVVQALSSIKEAEFVIVKNTSIQNSTFQDQIFRDKRVKILDVPDGRNDYYKYGADNSRGNYIFLMGNNSIFNHNAGNAIKELLKTSKLDIIELGDDNESTIDNIKQIQNEFLYHKLNWNINNKFIKRSTYIKTGKLLGNIMNEIKSEKLRNIIEMSSIYLTSTSYKYAKGDLIFSKNNADVSLEPKELNFVTKTIYELYTKYSQMKKEEIDNSKLFKNYNFSK